MQYGVAAFYSVSHVVFHVIDLQVFCTMHFLFYICFYRTLDVENIHLMRQYYCQYESAVLSKKFCLEVVCKLVPFGKLKKNPTGWKSETKNAGNAQHVRRHLSKEKWLTF